MKPTVMLCLYAMLFIAISCSDSGTTPEPSTQTQATGSMLVKFAEPPAGISTVIARLSRAGFSDRTLSLSISDSSASGSFDEVPVGRWHLRIDAKDSAQVVRYSGETDVDVHPGEISYISLQLLPTTGRIVIVVTWGPQSQDPSLVLYYPFNGNANDESGHNHNGVVHNATLVADRFGNPNKAYLFNGVSSYVDAGLDSALNPARGLTISVWIKYTGGPSYKNIFSRWDVFDGVDERTYVLNIDANNRLGFWISPDGTHWNSSVALDPGVLPVTGDWIHIAATWDGMTMRLFKNGSQVATAIVNTIARSPLTRTGVGAALGRIEDPAIGSFTGVLDDLRFYNRGLIQEEVRTLYAER